MLKKILISSLSALWLIGFATLAQATTTDTPAPTVPTITTVVVPIQATQPEKRSETLQALDSIRKVIVQQDGLVDETLLENKSAKGVFSYVHVMRWNSESQWHTMLSNAAFLEAVKSNRDFFTIDEAMTYQPVKPAN